MSARAYVGVGSNIDAEHHVRAAVRELARAARVVGVPADPQIGGRAFIAWPLAEIAPRLEVGGRAFQTIADGLSRDGMVPLPELTAALREEVRHG